MPIDQETGEVIQEQVEGARSFNQFLANLQDGYFHDKLSADLRELNAEMNDHVLDCGKRAKAKITIEIDITLQDGLFTIYPKHKIKKPEAPIQMSVMWSTPGNNFTPYNPKQQELFKDVNARVIKNIS